MVRADSLTTDFDDFENSEIASSNGEILFMCSVLKQAAHWFHLLWFLLLNRNKQGSQISSRGLVENPRRILEEMEGTQINSICKEKNPWRILGGFEDLGGPFRVGFDFGFYFLWRPKWGFWWIFVPTYGFGLLLLAKQSTPSEDLCILKTYQDFW